MSNKTKPESSDTVRVTAGYAEIGKRGKHSGTLFILDRITGITYRIGLTKMHLACLARDIPSVCGQPPAPSARGKTSYASPDELGKAAYMAWSPRKYRHCRGNDWNVLKSMRANDKYLAAWKAAGVAAANLALIRYREATNRISERE